jgi:tRNA modification GTPase
MATSGARLSEPGEFTKRAFLNGRLDLTQAEAVLDVIRAKTDLSLQAALLHLQGRLSYRIGKMKERLVRIAAHLEAYIDFPEQDIEISSRNEMHQELTDILNEIQTLLSSFKTGAILRQGILVAIVGKPNVGKSSLFNTLLDRDRAIVSDVAGTTRDTLEEMIDLKGLPVRLVDTAGVTETKDRVEKMGIERTHQSIQEADFCIFVCDGSQGLTKEDQQLAQLMKSEKTLCVINKNDLAQKIDAAQLADWTRVKKQISVSTQTRNGFDELENALFELIGVGGQERADVGISKERHRQALLKTEAALQALIGDLKANQSFEFLSLNVREALDGLGELVGEIYTEDILDVIFQEFCIGK